jgi:uncharacterized membrane protein SirB2
MSQWANNHRSPSFWVRASLTPLAVVVGVRAAQFILRLKKQQDLLNGVKKKTPHLKEVLLLRVGVKYRG